MGGLVVYSRAANPPLDVSNIDTNSIIAASDQNGQIGDQVFGNPDSKVVFIEYGDFQCPGCGGIAPQIKAATEEYKDKVAFIFRNFPLTTIHPNARTAAAAAEAAGLQGKYWEMHNLIYESQSEWENIAIGERNDKFVFYANEIGLDEAQFKIDIASPEVNKKISFDQAISKKVGVEATPTLYLNGKKLSSEDSSAITQGDTSVLTKLFDKALAE
jgi:protein-disulfide isomerase